MSAYEAVEARLEMVHERTMRVLQTLSKCERVLMHNDGHDEARVLAMLKHVVNVCTATQDFSEFAILFATLTLDTHACPIYS